jgi:peptidoglycan hydrolase-like protein with peptidoglycan-binding domain
MFYSYLLSASALATVSLGVLLYAVAGQGAREGEGVQVRAGAVRRPEELTARYRDQTKLTQETLRDLGYAPGPSDGMMGSETASALRAFQTKEGLRVTGRANLETLSALGIEDRLSRRAR